MEKDVEHHTEQDTKPSKQSERWERKKRKIKAFLDLCDHDEVSDAKKIKEDCAISESSATISEVDDDTAAKVPNGRTMASMPDDERKQLKALLKQKKKALMQLPKLFLTLDKIDPACNSRQQTSNTVLQLSAPQDTDYPIFTSDLQSLLLYACIGNLSSYKPRWCKLLRVESVRHVMVISIDGLAADDFHENKDSFPFLQQTFDMSVEMVPAAFYGKTLAEELFTVLSSRRQVKQVQRAARIDEAATHVNIAREHVLIDQHLRTSSPPTRDVDMSCSRKHLLLSHEQMLADNFPSPTGTGVYSHYVFTQDVYKRVHRHSPIFAVDCEMCMSVENRLVLTRIAIVNEQLETVYHTLVQPTEKIKDYLTRFSGITKKLLQGVTKTLRDVQEDIRSILPPDAILCGHSLNSDLHAMQMFHPYVIDTSVIYCLSGNRKMKSSLRNLASMFLSQKIQENMSGHNPIEDARATMELLKLKLSRGLAFGDVTMGPIHTALPDQITSSTGSASPRMDKPSDSTASSDEDASTQAHFQQQAFAVGNQPGHFSTFWSILADNGRTGTMCDHTDIVRDTPRPYGIASRTCLDNEEVLQEAQRAINNKQYFLWCRLHENKEPSATDATVQQLTSMLPPGALVAVVLNGIMLSPKTCKNALVLVKLT